LTAADARRYSLPHLARGNRCAQMSAVAFRRVVTRLWAVAQKPFSIPPHLLRPLNGFQLAHQGVDTQSLQHQLRHKNIQHTVRELSPERFRDFWNQPNSSCEEGCCSRDYEQDATRHAALRCLLRVTADDIRQRYSVPVSGILAPQRVSNLRIVTKL